jgi:hypothetical protein
MEKSRISWIKGKSPQSTHRRILQVASYNGLKSQQTKDEKTKWALGVKIQIINYQEQKSIHYHLQKRLNSKSLTASL